MFGPGWSVSADGKAVAFTAGGTATFAHLDPRPALESGPYAALVANLGSGSDEPEVLTTSASGKLLLSKEKYGR